MSRSLFVLCCLAIVVVSLFNIVNVFLTPITRLWILLVGSIAPSSFILSLALYEGQVNAACFTVKFRWHSLLTLLVLLWPTAVLILRYQIFSVDNISYAKSISILAFAILLAGISGLERFGVLVPLFGLFSHLKYVMVDAWDRSADQGFPKSVVDSVQIAHVREHCFLDKDSLLIFQATLSCPQLESAAIAKITKNPCLTGQHGQIRILDIGGGDGHLTSLLLREKNIDARSIDEIVLLDPIDWLQEYRAAMETLGVPPKKVVQIRKYLGDVPVDDQFDLVLAAHSLYFENVLDRVVGPEQLLSRVLKWRKPEGTAAIVIASRRGRAYEFKRAALQQLFGTPIEDIAGEDFSVEFQRWDTDPRYVDNIIVLDPLLLAYRTGDKLGLQRWLTYFLRYPFVAKTNDTDMIVELLERFVLPLKNLPEGQVSRYCGLHLQPTPDSLVLLHKTMVWTLEATHNPSSTRGRTTMVDRRGGR